jgi:hypothetical protein
MEELISSVVEGFSPPSEGVAQAAHDRKVEESTRDLVDVLYTPNSTDAYKDVLYNEIAYKVDMSTSLVTDRKEPNVYPIHLHVKNGDIVRANINNRDDSLSIVARGAGENIDKSIAGSSLQVKCFKHKGGDIMESKQFLSFRVLNTNNTKRFDVFFEYALAGNEIRLPSGEPPGSPFWKSFYEEGRSSVLVSEEDMGFDYLTDERDDSKSRLILPGRDVIEPNESVQFNLSSDADPDVELAYDIFLVFFEKIRQ